MHFDESDTQQVKEWITKRLENVSDADSDVLADYVLALVKSDEPDEQVRSMCLENLEDFLHDNTESFVDEVITGVKTKTYLSKSARPAAAPSAPIVPPATSAVSANPVTHHSSTGTNSRKRSHGAHEEIAGATDSHYMRGGGRDRGNKQMKRGGFGGPARGAARGGYGPNGSQASFPSQPGMNPFAQSFSPNQTQAPPMPQMDTTNLMASLAAMQAMGGMPGFEQFMNQGSPQQGQPFKPPQSQYDFQHQASFQPWQQQPPTTAPTQRCRDYDTKGFCARGHHCPYAHGDDKIVLPNQTVEEYDPNNATMPMTHQQRPHAPSTRGRGRGGRQQHGNHQNNHRADFSSPNPHHASDAIVVENIPAESFNEDSVREFFQQFGELESVELQNYKSLAIVKFKTNDSAEAAYQSPKVVFENRFVKVYWYKPDRSDRPGSRNGSGEGSRGRGRGRGGHGPGRATFQQGQTNNHQDTEMEEPPQLTAEEIAELTRNAQKAHEEKMAKLAEATARREDLAKRIKAQAEERERLMKKLAERTGEKVPASNGHVEDKNSADVDSDMKGTEPANGTEQTEALKKRLAELKAEASSLGLPEDASATPGSWSNDHNGYGGYNPYNSYRGGRGRGRGSYRARGYNPYARASAAGAVARLDNRPRNLAITAQNADVDIRASAPGGEALRSFMFTNNITHDKLVAHPDAEKHDESKTVVAIFGVRYKAEMLLDAVGKAGKQIEGVGPVEIAWVPNQEVQALISANDHGGEDEKEQPITETRKGGQEIGELGVGRFDGIDDTEDAEVGVGQLETGFDDQDGI